MHLLVIRSLTLCNQFLRRNLGAVPAHRFRHITSAHPYLRLQTLRERAGKRLSGWWFGCVRRTNIQCVDSPRPVVLIVVVRNHDLWYAGERGYRRCARAAMVHNGSNAQEQRIHVTLLVFGKSLWDLRRFWWSGSGDPSRR
jgi:hypothetical protein